MWLSNTACPTHSNTSFISIYLLSIFYGPSSGDWMLVLPTSSLVPVSKVEKQTQGHFIWLAKGKRGESFTSPTCLLPNPHPHTPTPSLQPIQLATLVFQTNSEQEDKNPRVLAIYKDWDHQRDTHSLLNVIPYISERNNQIWWHRKSLLRILECH